MYVLLYNTIKWPYQPKHSPSFVEHSRLLSQGSDVLALTSHMVELASAAKYRALGHGSLDMVH